MKDRNGEAYKEEALELLAELEISLLALEQDPGDEDLIGRVFRAMHTIKGSGAMFGFDDIAAFTHEVETVFDLVRNGKIAVTRELVDLSLAARDEIRAMLDGDDMADGQKKAQIIADLRQLTPDAAVPAGPTPALPPGALETPGGGVAVTYRIRFRPAPEIFLTGTNPIHLLNELRELGEMSLVAHTADIPFLQDLNPEHCHTSWDIFLTTTRGYDAIADVFIFVADDSDLSIQVIDDGLGEEPDYKRLGEILVERGDLDQSSLDRLLAKRPLIGETLIAQGVLSKEKVATALAEQQHVRAIQKKRLDAEGQASIRVPSAKLDKLVDLVGELVTVQARLSQTALNSKDSQLQAIAEEVERLTGGLRDNVLNIRMLPIGTIFSKFQRLVRDLSSELGRDVDLITAGAETEMDKTVLERLNDPLVHLIRNSVDHGIELPEVRRQQGKPGKGRVSLVASHAGAEVVIQVKDDGRGLDPEAIRAKAVQMGLLTADTDISQKELFSFIMSPGFSTAREVTSVSGRGVGMDVVKKAIETLRGSMEIDSQRGVGTTFTIKLPLTLAIIEGLLVTIEREFFVVPLSVVTECVELTRTDVARAHGHKIARVRDEIVPYVHLRERFAMAGAPPAIEQIVITEMNGTRVGLVVDQVIGEQQTVIKSLGRVYRGVEGISGATLLGDGTVALILDASQLIHGQGGELMH